MSRSIGLTEFVLLIIPTLAIGVGLAEASAVPAHLQATQTRPNYSTQNEDAAAENELRVGIALTGQGRFSDAIPHLLAAQGHASNEYAAGFDLALCYVATGQNPNAIQILKTLSSQGHRTPEVYNLLAQALIGDSQPGEAFDAFERAVALAPKSEKLYILAADSCMDHQLFELGLKVADAGLQQGKGDPNRD